MYRNPLAALGALSLAVTLSLNPAGVARAEDPATDAGAAPVPVPGLGSGGQDVWSVLNEVKRVTAAYHDVAAAEADGYRQSSTCQPGKGIHYLRSVAEGPEELVLDQPNALVYAPRPDGELKLLGIEYVSRTPATLFGREFQQSPAVFYYTLHVWVWENGPEDLFAADNPRITCDV
jgi:hypothetical protein